MSKTEQDLDASVADDAVDELTVDELDTVDVDIDDEVEDDLADDVDTDGVDAEVVDGGADDEVDDDVADDDALDEALVDSIEEYTADGSSVAASTDVDDDAVVAELDAELDDRENDDADSETDDQAFDVPRILLVTEHDDDVIPPVVGDEPRGPNAKDQPDVSEDILEELRRADIDGPIVELAPQDDTTSARRRPKRAVDYDPAPVPIPLKVPRILGRKPRVRKVTRVVRHVDPWSVFKIAIIANMVLYIIVLTAGVLLWNVAYVTGTVSNVERFFESFGWQSFEFNGGEIYHGSWIAGLFVVLGLTGLMVLFATLFNLITDLVGGVRFTVLEEEVVESRSSPMRRFVVRRPEPVIPSVVSDSSGSFIREAVVDDTGGVAGIG